MSDDTQTNQAPPTPNQSQPALVPPQPAPAPPPAPQPTISPNAPPFPNRPSLQNIVQEGTVPTITREVKPSEQKQGS